MVPYLGARQVTHDEYAKVLKAPLDEGELRTSWRLSRPGKGERVTGFVDTGLLEVRFVQEEAWGSLTVDEVPDWRIHLAARVAEVKQQVGPVWTQGGRYRSSNGNYQDG